MIELRRQAGLAHEPLADLVIAGVVVREQLDRHPAVELQVPGRNRPSPFRRSRAAARARSGPCPIARRHQSPSKASSPDRAGGGPGPPQLGALVVLVVAPVAPARPSRASFLLLRLDGLGRRRAVHPGRRGRRDRLYLTEALGHGPLDRVGELVRLLGGAAARRRPPAPPRSDRSFRRAGRRFGRDRAADSALLAPHRSRSPAAASARRAPTNTQLSIASFIVPRANRYPGRR